MKTDWEGQFLEGAVLSTPHEQWHLVSRRDKLNSKL